MNFGLHQPVQRGRYLGLVAVQNFLLIEIKSLAIGSQKRPVVHASRQIHIAAFFQGFEVVLAYLGICGHLSKRNILLLAC